MEENRLKYIYISREKKKLSPRAHDKNVPTEGSFRGGVLEIVRLSNRRGGEYRVRSPDCVGVSVSYPKGLFYPS